MLTTALLGIFSVLALVMAVFYGIRMLRRSKYPATTGVIISSGIIYNVDAFLDFTYQFTVDGIRYIASTVYSLDSNFQRVDSPEEDWILKRIVARLPKGSTVVVKYNSKSPAECFLVNGPLLNIITPLAVSIAFFLFLLHSLIFS